MHNKSGSSLESGDRSQTHSFVPRVASLVQMRNQSTPHRIEELTKARRDRLVDSQKRVYDPMIEPTVGLDSPGVNFGSLVTIGNQHQN